MPYRTGAMLLGMWLASAGCDSPKHGPAIPIAEVVRQVRLALDEVERSSCSRLPMGPATLTLQLDSSDTDSLSTNLSVIATGDVVADESTHSVQLVLKPSAAGMAQPSAALSTLGHRIANTLANLTPQPDAQQFMDAIELKLGLAVIRVANTAGPQIALDFVGSAPHLPSPKHTLVIDFKSDAGVSACKSKTPASSARTSATDAGNPE